MMPRLPPFVDLTVCRLVFPQNDMSTARDVLMRILLMGAVPGALLGLVFLVAQVPILLRKSQPVCLQQHVVSVDVVSLDY